MTTRKATLGELETLMLLAVLRLGESASVRRIRAEVADRGGRDLSRGATYATLGRLERKGFLEVRSEEPDSGGRAEHRFTVSELGLETLRVSQQFLTRMRAGLESVLDPS